MAWLTDGQSKVGQNERYVYSGGDNCESRLLTRGAPTDQQIGQLYELMNAIREQELEENDPEYVKPSKA